MTGVIHRRWIWLKRFRQRRGYGVHSPFAFNFLTYVVYERGTYYAYKWLKNKYFCMDYLWNGHRVKCRKFLFRMANFVHPQTIAIFGKMDEASVAYLSAGSVSSKVQQVEESADTGDKLLVVGMDVPHARWRKILEYIHTEKSVCLIAGIHTSKSNLQAWRDLCQTNTVFVSFDLYDYGILFFDSSKQKQHYIVNF